MFIDDLPVYIPKDAGPLSTVGEQVNTLLLLPGDANAYAEADRKLLQRMMSAINVAEDAYRIIFVPDKVLCRLSAMPGNGQVRQIINMGVDWHRLGLHVELPLYHAARVGNFILVSADQPSRLAKDSLLKKQLWEQLMRMHLISQS